jgi:uncharacterized protein YjcR
MSKKRDGYKIPKAHYPIIAAMRLSGSKWAEIAAIYGCSTNHLKNLKSVIMDGFTEVERIRKSDLAKTVATHLALTAEKEETKLSAAKSLMEPGVAPEEDSQSRTKGDEQIVRELKIELSSQG